MKEVEVQGTVIEFPDEMSWEEIETVLARQFPAPEAAPVEQRSMREQAAEGITLRPFGIDTGIELPQEAVETLAGAGRRLSEIGTLGFHETPQAADELLDQSGYATAGGVVADLAGFGAGGLAARGALQGASMLPRVSGIAQRLLAAPTTNPILTAAGTGALYGGATMNDRAEGAFLGGLGGAAGGALTRGLAAVTRPNLQPGARELAGSGVQLTPGRMLGGTTQRLEDAATSVPIVGDAIQGAQRRSLESFNRVAINDVLKVVDEALPDDVPVGRQAVAYAGDVLRGRYDDILGAMDVVADGPMMGTLARIERMTRRLPETQQRWIRNNFNDEFVKAFDNPSSRALGRTFKTLMADLRENYQRALRSSDVQQQDAGKAMREIHRAMMEAAKRQNRELARELVRTDRAYAALSRVRGAAEAGGAKEGVFSPHQLVSEIRKNARGSSRFAEGRAIGQEFAEQANTVLPQRVPDSGSIGRLLTAGLPLGAAAVDPMMGAAALGGVAPYTRTGQAIMRGLIGARPDWTQTARSLLDQSIPYAGMLGASVNLN